MWSEKLGMIAIINYSSFACKRKDCSMVTTHDTIYQNENTLVILVLLWLERKKKVLCTHSSHRFGFPWNDRFMNIQKILAANKVINARTCLHLYFENHSAIMHYSTNGMVMDHGKCHFSHVRLLHQVTTICFQRRHCSCGRANYLSSSHYNRIIMSMDGF